MFGQLSRTSRIALLTTKQSGHLMKGIAALICALALAKADPVRTNIASYDETDPKQAPIICATDKSDGILVAHENCNQFYQCWDGLPIARDCYGNLHYNPTTEICDWPDNVDCGGRLIPQDSDTNENENEVSEEDNHGGNGGNGAGNCDPSQAGSICAKVGSDGTFVAHENCNKYYICDNGVPVIQRCPGTLLFDPFKDYCDWPESVDCGDRVICEESEEDNGHSENGGSDNSGNVGTGAGNCDPSQAGNICAIEGSEGTLVAHEHCNKYYICANGLPAVQKCPGTLLFDPFKDYCDWPGSVECGDRIICDDSEEDTSNSENGGNNDGGSVGNGAGNCDPSQAGNICAAEGSDGVLVAHENCNKYYICSHGVPVVQRCPGTLLFDPFKDHCDWPENVDCGDRLISESSEEDANKTENGDSENGGSVGTGAGNCDPSQAGNICAAEGSDGVLVAHENCNKYYICSHGEPVIQRCPGGLLFDPFKDYCDWPDNVDCEDRAISESSEEDANKTENGDSDNGGSIGTGAGNCDPSQAGNICAAEGSDGVLVAHENCNKYYICNHGVPVVQRCPGTLLFDPFMDHCDWPENVECGDRLISESSEEDANKTENGDNDNGGSVGTGAGNCDPSQAGNICTAEGSDGVLVAHENCNKYYICTHGEPVIQRCPGGLLFDPFKDYCDWPDNVDCGDRVISESSEEDANKTENGDSDNGGSVGTGAGNCDPSQAGNICAAEGSDGVLVAHKNCNKYYICNHGVPVVQRCPGSLLFDPFKDYCDWPENVECDERVIPEVNSEEDDSGNGETDTGSNEGSDNGGSENGGAGTCNCNPGEAPAICAIDGSDNTLVAHENCNQFYTCAAGKPVTLTCPGTTLYNPYTEQCDWPENVECGERVIPEVNSEEDDGKNEETDANSSESEDSNTDGSDNGGSDNGGAGTCNCNPGEAPAICAIDGSDNTLVAHDNCNQFYTCAAGKPVTLTCPGTTLYNPYTEQCDWPENVECGERVIPEVNSKEDDGKNEETDANSSESEDSNTDGSDNGGSDNGGAGTCNCNPGEAPAICAIDGSDNTLVAHENCNQFYTCAAGKPVTLTCPGTTLYNPYTEQCDWPENVECGERVIPEVNSEEDDGKNEETDANSSESEDSNTDGSDNGGSDNGGAGTCNCNPGEAPAICAIDGSDNTLVAHENCNQFYTCAAGKPVTLTCPGTTLYNPYTEQCDWPENVECGERVIPEVDTEADNNGNGEADNDGSENEGSDNGGSDNGGSGTCNCSPGEAPAICAVDGSDGTFVAHENCNQFYTCVAGQPATLTCPGSTLYNPYTQICDWPENVECGERVIPEVDTEEDNNGNEEADNDGSESEDSDNGGSDNGGSGTCNCSPGEAPAICAVDGSDGTFVAHENCNQFYTCVAGQPVSLTCPGSTLYNPYTQICDWPENVECGERVIPEVDTEEDNNGNEEADNDGSGSEDSDNGGSDNGGSGTCNCSPGEAPAICAVDGSDGTFVAHENCNQFYTCVAGQPVSLTCPGSTLYNPYTQICDWPENVECGERVIPEVDTEEDNNGNEEADNDGSESEDSDNGGSDNGGSGTCNCSPGEAPAICAVDGSDGTFVAHENCNQFYTCVGGQPATLTCPGSTLYNPYTQICDWPENVKCGERVIPEIDIEEDNNGNGEADNESAESEDSDNGGSDNGGSGTCNCNPGEAPAICSADGSDGTLVAHENCNQFYTCVGGQPATLTCPGSTLYNPYTQICDWPENVKCGERVIPEVDTEEDNNGNGEADNDGSESEDSDNGGSDNGGSGTCNCSPGEAPAICAVDGSDGTFVAHENCNQFYTCVAGQPVSLTCPGSTLYNPYTQICDWPENVECGERIIPEVDTEEDNNGNGEAINDSSESEGSDNGGSDNGGSGTCNCSPGEAPAICSADGSDGTLVAHENCNQFYTCIGGQPATLTCPGSTLYNPYTQICDWPENVECGERVIPEVDTEEDNNGNGEADNDGSESEDSDNGGSDNGGSGTCNCSPGEAPAICAVDGSDGTFVAHENCNQFYTCVAGQPVSLTCPGSTLYNPYTQICDWPENVECGERVIPEVDTEEDNNGNEEADNDGSGSEDSDNGGSDNGGSGTCNCSPGEAPAICAVDGSDGTFVAHENCNQFYTCVRGQPATLTCPGSTLYNPYTQICDWPENVKCGERVIPEVDIEEDNNGNGEADNESAESEDSDNGGSDNGGSGTCNCNPGEAPAICSAEGSDGTLVAHENCNQFYTCVGGQPATLTCPGSTLFNPYTQICDWPENVECGERVIPEVDAEEENNGNGEADNDGSESEDSDNGGSDNGGSGTCNCSPGEAPAICAVDGSDGTFVAHENCNQFYTCVGGQPATLTCPGSTLYNPYTQICDWPENVKCGERVIPEIDIEEDNNGNGEADNESAESEDSDNGSSDNGGSGTCNCSPGEAPAICAVDGSDGTFVAHENCNQFYTCVGGQPATLTCPGSTLYNPYTQICDWPENVKCGERVIPEVDTEEDNNGNGEADNESAESEDSDNGGSDNGSSGTCNCSPGEAPAICAVDGSDGTLVAHENCNQFYTCVGGQPATLTCPGSTLYNPYTQICDWPENVECGERIILEVDCDEDDNGNGETDTDNSSESEGSDDGGTDNGASGSCNCSPGEAPAICAADGSDGTFVAHENCNQFYTCVAGQPATINCPGSTLYNPYTQQCDWPENVNCGERLIPEEECEDNNDGDENENGSDNGGSNGGNSDNGSSSESGDLDNGSSENVDIDGSEEDNNTNEENENEGTGSESSEKDVADSSAPDNEDSDNEDTDNESSDSCNCNPAEAPAICAAFGSDGIMVAHENCNQFYTCLAGKPITLTCTGTTLYNPNTQRCDWPDNVSCGDRTNSQTNDTENENNDGNDNLDSEELETGNIDTEVTCAESNSEGVFLPAEKCNQFYVCIGSQPVIMSCSGNLLYNHGEKRCDWPENVNCGSRIIPSEDNEVPDVETDDVRVVDVLDDDDEETKAEQESENEFGYDIAVIRCADGSSAGAMVPHEECHRFYICMNSRPVVFTCTSDNLYDIEKQQCNYPQNVNCGGRLLRTV